MKSADDFKYLGVILDPTLTFKKLSKRQRCHVLQYDVADLQTTLGTHWHLKLQLEPKHLSPSFIHWRDRRLSGEINPDRMYTLLYIIHSFWVKYWNMMLIKIRLVSMHKLHHLSASVPMVCYTWRQSLYRNNRLQNAAADQSERSIQ